VNEADRDAVESALRSKAEDGTIACHDALATAAEFGMDSREVGRLLNEMKIKICHCQLGCFP
jgi:hypothetical protein